jgi:nicotinamidase-related amidase
MPILSKDLHGNAPDTAPVALLLIDVINDLEWKGGDRLLPHALAMAERLVALKERCQKVGIPAIYVNDNFGHWQSDFRKIVKHCRQDGVRGEPIARMLQPAEDDYFVLKPKHSGFYATALEILLQHLRAKTLIMTGIAGDNCVLFTAHDAYLRDYRIIAPRDCIASVDPGRNTAALEHMKRVLKVDTRSSEEIDLQAPGKGGRGARGIKRTVAPARGSKGRRAPRKKQR